MPSIRARYRTDLVGRGGRGRSRQEGVPKQCVREVTGLTIASERVGHDDHVISLVYYMCSLFLPFLEPSDLSFFYHSVLC